MMILLLTFPPWWVYAVPIVANAAVWFERQEQKRIAALRGIFMSVHMTSLSFFWAGRLGSLALAGASVRSFNPLDTAHPIISGGIHRPEKRT